MLPKWIGNHYKQFRETNPQLDVVHYGVKFGLTDAMIHKCKAWEFGGYKEDELT